jgi:hypothetical protein
VRLPGIAAGTKAATRGRFEIEVWLALAAGGRA